MFDPFLGLMLAVGGFMLFFVVYRARLNMAIKGVFHNPSYQLGMVFAVCCTMFILGTEMVILWLIG
jgi:hypothetical protein